MVRSRFFALVMWLVLAVCTAGFAQTDVVSSVTPLANSFGSTAAINLEIAFNQSMDQSTLTFANIKVGGSITGYYGFSVDYDGGTDVLTINPNNDFKANEVITVTLTEGVLTSGTEPAAGYSWSFTVAAGVGTTAYETSQTLAVDGSPYNILFLDIDNDTDPDLVTANFGGGTISISVNTDGHFSDVSYVSAAPMLRGLAAADFDSDGDLDLTTANGNNSISVLMNMTAPVHSECPLATAPALFHTLYVWPTLTMMAILILPAPMLFRTTSPSFSMMAQVVSANR